ncbi:protein Simiate-like [Stylophora pistillata]|uniref:protein Simiate-like n=1 Tax=Stylophora pistillata TaxID=50429 RepID=UPI000C047462|nr:protein Simiate-like [Stylophora pistillata]
MADAEDAKCRERKSVVERYFTRIFKTDIMGKFCEDQCVLQHSNKICVITVAPSHPLLRCKQIVKVDFQYITKITITTLGQKSGLFWMDLKFMLFEILLKGKSCIKGKLVEVNEELVTKPQLLLEKPETEGYLAVVLPKLTENILDGLLTKEEYEQLLEDREGQSGCAKATGL